MNYSFNVKNLNGGPLYAPPGYWLLIPKQKEQICNGVGPRGIGWLFPETIWGLSITVAANIHDYCFYCEKNFADSNRLFYDNIKRQIKRKGGFLKYPRLCRAQIYYRILQVAGRLFY